MKLDLNRLTDAVKSVAGIAAARDALSEQCSALLADHRASQDEVDALTASLLAATTSPAGAVGIVAVAAALTPEALALPVEAPVVPVAPVDVTVAANVPVDSAAPAAAPVDAPAPVAPVDAPVAPVAEAAPSTLSLFQKLAAMRDNAPK